MIRWDSKIVLFKTESSYGVDSSPAGANALLMTGVTYAPMDGEDKARNLDFPYMAAQGKLPAGLRIRLRGRVELQGSGTAGTAPAWSDLVRAGRWAQTVNAGVSVVLSPVSDSISSGTLKFWIGETLQTGLGARCNLELMYDAQGIPYVSVEIVAIYSPPEEEARVTPTLTGFKRPTLVSHQNTPVFTVDGVSLVMRSFRMNMNNRLLPYFLVGQHSIEIARSAESASMRVKAVPLTTFDPFALAESGEQVPIVLTHGTQAGYISTLSQPKVELGRVQEYVDADGVTEWNIPLTPLPTAANNQWTLTLT